MKRIECFERVKVYCNERLRFQQSMQAQVSLRSLLNSFYDSECADPADGVYAMLSLARGGEAFQIDYREPTIELLFRTLCFCKPKTLQKAARLSSLLMRILILEPPEQRFVQDFLSQPQSSFRSDMSVFHLPASVIEFCFKGSDEATLGAHTATIMLGCPRRYDGDPDVQHLFNFVTQESTLSRPPTCYLIFVTWLSMSLELICAPQILNDEPCSVVGIAVHYRSQLTDHVYILMDSEKLTGVSIQRSDVHDVNEITLGYDQMLCALDYMRFQRDAWNEEHVTNDIYFGKPQEVVLKLLSKRSDDEESELDDEDSELDDREESEL